VLAQYLGVSLFTWTGIIGVMLAGTALGNLTGGLVADRVNRPGSAVNPRSVLAGTLIVAAAGTIFILLLMWYFSRNVFIDKGPLADMSPIGQVIISTFSLFFLPMYLLGMISPQVIRLAVPDVAHVGRVAGRVYAWSTTGAIVGTFATGYVLLSTLGMNNTLLAVSLVLVLTSLLVARVWNENLMLYLFSLVLGGVTGGFILNIRTGRDPDVVTYESNYYTITVGRGVEPEVDEFGRFVFNAEGQHVQIRVGVLVLDHLKHSVLFPDRPDKLYYTHEYVQMEFLQGARAASPNPRVLVIGGGGYTFPRYAMENLPETRMDVVEIDPGVTKVAREHLGLKDYEGMTIVHMDGRQFVAEKAEPGTYDLVIQDAVNDLSVPSHLLTKEYNEAVKRALKPGGVYLLTVIDNVTIGELWKAAMYTLRETYPADNVCLLQANSTDVSVQAVYVIYASDTPLDLDSLQKAVQNQFPDERRFAAGLTARAAVGGGAAGAAPGGSHHALAAVAAVDSVFELVMDRMVRFRTRRIPEETLRPYLEAGKKIILTDQFAPVDNLMAEVFRKRKPKPPPDSEKE
jgi:spermidine synthase